GREFRDDHHSWSGDLDVFGRGSLFQKLNQCRTFPAQKKLAEWLTTVAAPKTVAERAQQAESLRTATELRERLAMIDDTVDWAVAVRTLERWADEAPQKLPAPALWFSRILAVAAAAVIAGTILGILPGSLLLLVMLLQVPGMYACRRQIRGVMEHAAAVERPLRQLAEVSLQFEQYDFDEPSLIALRQRLTADGMSASKHIHQLSNTVQWLNNALCNQFFLPPAWMFGLFLELPYRVERWRTNYGHRIDIWLDTVAALEVILTVAAHNYEQQETWCLPKISDETAEFVASGLGHPLIPAAMCVRNDVALSQAVPLILISGSNMSGKSTLLRSVGTNLVLANCGCRVCAEKLTAYPFRLATAMRVSDSLQEGRSLFMTVLQRLKTVVDLTGESRRVLFLLDEILSGTNSHDRLRGAEAVIRNLVERQALGLVTTHDLALTKIIDSMDGRGVNMHFEDQVTDGHMTFDYRLRPGVVRRSNAIELMRMIGLDV
ncbi:MAG: hypothetical protein KDA89_14265, partial [Planctomycetaceae bacterium]|nr:hypothetical protein [Planctomycetaceae bacterium]